MKNLIYICALWLLSLAACKTPQATYKAYNKDISTQNIVDNYIIQTPTVVDLDISEAKVTGRYSGENVSMDYARNKALNDAITKSGADVLVEPMYELDIDGKTTTASVTGYPAKYKNFRQPQTKDSVLLNWRKEAVNSASVLRQEKPKNITTVENNMSKCETMHSTGNTLTYTGVGLLVAGAGMVAGGAVYSTEGGEDDATIPMIAIGGVMAATGVFLVPFGVTLTKKAKICAKYKGNFNGAQLHFNPVVAPFQNQYAMGLQLKF